MKTNAENHTLSPNFDPLYMADRKLDLVGLVPTYTMPRLRNAVISRQPVVTVHLHFSRENFGYCTVDGDMMCTLRLRCERCLGEVEAILNPIVKLIMKPEFENITEKIGEYDLYEYSGNGLELSNLVEDELLLTLPIALKHKDISLCNSDMVAWLASGREPGNNKETPFAILKC